MLTLSDMADNASVASDASTTTVSAQLEGSGMCSLSRSNRLPATSAAPSTTKPSYLMPAHACSICMRQLLDSHSLD